MPSDDDYKSPIFAILIKLYNGEKFTTRELSTEFDTDIRNIQRYMKRLTFLPIKKEKHYYFLESYALGKLSFDDIKNFAAISGVKNLFPSLTNEFIIDLLNAKINSAYLVKSPQYEEIIHNKENFDNLSVAIVSYMAVQCIYKKKLRLLYPYKLVNHHGIWYLVADDGGVLKNFSFSKITDLQIVHDKQFKPNRDFLDTLKKNNADWFSQNVVNVTLKINPQVGEYFLKRKLLSNQTVIKQTPNELIIKATVSYDDEILRIVQYWLPHIEIVSPEHLQEKLIETLQGYLKAT
ncbi:MAG: WYL domain-containing protein [Pseudomonadota bacterium]